MTFFLEVMAGIFNTIIAFLKIVLMCWTFFSWMCFFVNLSAGSKQKEM